MMHSVRTAVRAIALVIASLCCLATHHPARADEFPPRTIRILIPFSPGGPNDVIGRPLADKMAELLGTTIVIENRPGAQGRSATQAVARSPPDGATILMTTGSHVANQVLYANLAYDALADFTALTLLAESYGVALVTRPDLPAGNIRELIALAKLSPGKYTYGHPGVGNANHIAGELLQKICDVQLLAVPYKGSGSYVTDIISGQVDLGFMSTAVATPNVQSRLLKAFAVTGPARAPSLPDVPTMIESGYPDFNWTGYFGLFLPAGLPADRVARLNQAAVEAIRTPLLRKVLADSGLALVGSTPEAFARYLAKDLAHQRAVAQRIGLREQP